MINVWDLNTRVIIAFALTMIVALLAYLAFFKKSIENSHIKPKIVFIIENRN